LMKPIVLAASVCMKRCGSSICRNKLNISASCMLCACSPASHFPSAQVFGSSEPVNSPRVSTASVRLCLQL
jgi:hypothetical protein